MEEIYLRVFMGTTRVIGNRPCVNLEGACGFISELYFGYKWVDV